MWYLFRAVLIGVLATDLPEIPRPAAVFYIPDAYELVVLQAPIAATLTQVDFEAARCNSSGALHAMNEGDIRTGKFVKLLKLREYAVLRGKWILMATELDIADLSALLETTGGSTAQHMPLVHGWAVELETHAQAQSIHKEYIGNMRTLRGNALGVRLGVVLLEAHGTQ